MTTETRTKNSERLAILFKLMGPDAFEVPYKKMTEEEFQAFVEAGKK